MPGFQSHSTLQNKLLILLNYLL